MRIIILASIISLSFMNAASASLYQCNEANNEPTAVIPNNQILNISYEKKAPIIRVEAKDKKYHKKRRIPFLIYYAIDSTEPFMQHSINLEISQLAKSCQDSEFVNFAALLNSLYVNKNEIIICKKKTLRFINLSKYPSLNNELKVKRKYLSEGDHTSDETGPLNYLVKYYKHTNEAFGNFPLAHPDFLYDLINLLITDQDLFPNKDFMPFLNLKSHGSNETVLSGLYYCQIKAKTLTQQEIIRSILTIEEISILSTFQLGQLENLKRYEEILAKLYLGTNAGMGGTSLSGDYNLSGDHNLGRSRMLGTSINLNSSAKLGNSIVGLGANDGLGTQQAFGLYHIALNAVLNELFNIQNERVLGFMMLESCDSNRDSTFSHEYMKNILGYYSATHSLWYRNLNWWSLLVSSNNSSLKLLNLLESNTKEIQNIQIIE